jgi:hypothetical protein
MAFAKSSGLSFSTKRNSIPKRLKKTLNWLKLPPYRYEVVTMLSPASAIVAKARNCRQPSFERSQLPESNAHLSSLPRRRCEGADTALERREPFLKDVDGGILDPRVDVSHQPYPHVG